MEKYKVNVVINDVNDDNVMSASVWFEIFGDYVDAKSLWFMGGKCENKEGGLNWAHPFPHDFGI